MNQLNQPFNIISRYMSEDYEWTEEYYAIRFGRYSENQGKLIWGNRIYLAKNYHEALKRRNFERTGEWSDVVTVRMYLGFTHILVTPLSWLKKNSIELLKASEIEPLDEELIDPKTSKDESKSN